MNEFSSSVNSTVRAKMNTNGGTTIITADDIKEFINKSDDKFDFLLEVVGNSTVLGLDENKDSRKSRNEKTGNVPNYSRIQNQIFEKERGCSDGQTNKLNSSTNAAAKKRSSGDLEGDKKQKKKIKVTGDDVVDNYLNLEDLDSINEVSRIGNDQIIEDEDDYD